jgi:hypothetical protein
MILKIDKIWTKIEILINLENMSFNVMHWWICEIYNAMNWIIVQNHLSIWVYVVKKEWILLCFACEYM